MVEIKEIKKKKKKNKYIIVFGNYDLEVFEEVIIKFMLLKKRDLELDEYNELIKYNDYINALHLAINYLKKPRTILEVRRYLKELKCFGLSMITSFSFKSQTEKFQRNEFYRKESRRSDYRPAERSDEREIGHINDKFGR